jgi:hypothetical protein
MHPCKHKVDAPISVFFNSFIGGKTSDGVEQCHAWQQNIFVRAW